MAGPFFCRIRPAAYSPAGVGVGWAVSAGAVPSGSAEGLAVESPLFPQAVTLTARRPARRTAASFLCFMIVSPLVENVVQPHGTGLARRAGLSEATDCAANTNVPAWSCRSNKKRPCVQMCCNDKDESNSLRGTTLIRPNLTIWALQSAGRRSDTPAR